MTDQLLSLAREVGMSECFGNDIDEDWENHYTFSGSGLVALEQRIRQDERERFLELFNECLPDVVGAVLAGAGYAFEEVDRITPRALGMLEVLKSVAAIRSSGTSGSNPGKSDE